MLAQSSSPQCFVTAVAPTIRAEGVAERLGDIVVSCTATPGTTVTGNLTVFVNTSITNRDASDNTVDVTLTVNGSLANVLATRFSQTQIAFNGLRFTFPPTGTVDLRISNLRGDASILPAASPFQPGNPVTAQLAFSPAGLLSFNRSSAQIGIAQRSLYATSQQMLVSTQLGSPLPDALTFSNAIQAGTFASSTRVTEGMPTAFEPQQTGTDTGTRIILRYSGFPSGARLLVPALVAGSNASVPTSFGDFGNGVSPGVYIPNSHTLALVRVQSTDAGGAGGFRSNAVSNELTEVTLNNGIGIAVYEVIDSDPLAVESAQIPVFLGLTKTGVGTSNATKVEVSYGPQSATAYPRFTATAATTDCSIFNDCGKFVPTLRVIPAANTFRLVQGGTAIDQFLLYNDGGGAIIPFAAYVEYKDGSGWIKLDPESDVRPRPVRMVVIATPQMAAGTYRATVVIDAGSAGVARFPITLEVVGLPPQPPVQPKPTVSKVIHGATFEAAPVARNAYYTLQGENLAGNNVSVTLNGTPVKTVYTSATQINFLVPADLPGSSAQLVVTVNGVASNPVNVQLTDAYPGIFTPGILNEDGTVNSTAYPAPAGTVVQIYATGLLGPANQGTVEAKLHDLTVTNLPYAGPAPGIPGLEQVNVLIPNYFPTMTTEVSLCTTATGARQCSAPVKIHVRQAQ